MALHVLASQAQSPVAVGDVKRRSANYPPSIWGDYFLSTAAASTEVDSKLEQQVQELKEEVRRMLMDPVDKPSQKLDMINNIQRLGVSYHFENEIGEILKHIHTNSHYSSEDHDNEDDLYTTALYFRLERQQGYYVSCDMFNKFKGSDGAFKESLVSDITGLLGLYEATHLRLHGENVLDEALIFTRTHLESVAHDSNSPFSKQAAHALYQPLWKGAPRIEARHFLSVYEENDSHDETLLAFAKVDFNEVQKVHQRELSEITRWWKELDLVNKLPFIRDRVVEAYLWSLMVYFEPEYCFARMTVTKYIALTTTGDDIYDVYGTYEELELFTKALERWDISAIEQLPKYMKIYYKALLDVYAGHEEKFANEGNLYPSHYAIEAIKIQLGAYWQEAKWLKEKYTPTMDEYMPVGCDSSFYPMGITYFAGMTAYITKESMEWEYSYPKISKCASVIGRLLNDMVGYKFEKSIEQGATVVECYMKQYGVTAVEAEIELTKQVDDEWKDLNKEWLDHCSNNTVPRPLLQILLNLARSGDVIYKNVDLFSNSKTLMKGYIISLFIQPVTV